MQRCIIIDDNDAQILIDECHVEARLQGIELDLIHFNPRGRKFMRINNAKTDSIEIDFDLIKQDFVKSVLNQKVDLIICDYSFADEKLDGFELLHWIRTVRKKTRLVLYSGQGEFETDFVRTHFSRTPAEIRKVISAKIDEIIPRDDRKGVMFRILRDEKYSLDSALQELLFKYSHLEFNNVYPAFAGMNLGDIASEIGKESARGFHFKENLIELSISHMLDLNK